MSPSAVNLLNNKASCSGNRSVSDSGINSGIIGRDPIMRLWEKRASSAALLPAGVAAPLSERLLELAFTDETFQAVSCMSFAVVDAYILLEGVQPYALMMIVGFFATVLFGLLLNLYLHQRDDQDDDTAAHPDSEVPFPSFVPEAFHEPADHQLIDSDTLLRKTNDEINEVLYEPYEYEYEAFEHAGYEDEGRYYNYYDAPHDMRRSLSELSFSSTGSTQDFE